MNLNEVLAWLEAHEYPQGKKVLEKHGAREPFHGIPLRELKPLAKKLRKEPEAHQLGLDLYATGNSDAMTLAAYIVDPQKITKEQLQAWAEQAYWYMLAEYSVATVASLSPYGLEKAREWINSDKEMVAAAGWATLCACLSIYPDEAWDHQELEHYRVLVEKEIHQAPNRVRYDMNQYLISLGAYQPTFLEICKETGRKLGKIKVDMGDTACKVPYPPEYLEKMESRGKIGVKRKANQIC